MSRGNKGGWSREQALTGRPVQAPLVSRERRGEKLYVTMEFARPRWQRALGAEAACRRTFGLDRYGEEVYAYCDGRTTTREMIDRFAGGHHISVAESEMAVTRFLRTLMEKGLIGVPVYPEDLAAATAAAGGKT